MEKNTKIIVGIVVIGIGIYAVINWQKIVYKLYPLLISLRSKTSSTNLSRDRPEGYEGETLVDIALGAREYGEF